MAELHTNPFVGAPLAPECNEPRHVFQGVDCCCDHGRLCACHVAVAPPAEHDAHVVAWACGPVYRSCM